ncbi:polysaccharide deacetylase family protein (plasmid) [Rhizobium sp. CB3171]|uniref:polysaccharide deacetylase family protein n=1 Tax=Rhizobium sp. CB3171 TaxID=3039157 RepID=UPI0024B1CC3B|nr:polysaccharide deacetylase family protein [Rhizobium sp. CB3171]WFU07349.1 polysaccharide deacetylase family protein [Rhizobium sp. CB3171]
MRLVIFCAAVIVAFSFCVPDTWPASRKIYLTFDDGPLPGSENVLHVLFEENVPATMFMVGVHVETKEDGRSVLAAVRSLENVAVGNHSYSHANNRYRVFYSDSQAVIADLAKANEVLGLAMLAATRLPGRNVFRLKTVSSEDLSLDVREWGKEWINFELIREAGFDLYGWDHEWVHNNDGKPIQSVETLVREIDSLFAYNRFVKPGKMILLMHDAMFQDKFNGQENLRALIRKLKQRGYQFSSLRDYESTSLQD